MSRPAQRGFTIIELLVGMLVSLLVIGIVMSTFLSQQRSMQALDLARDASSASRDGLLSMQATIGRAGYGVDPRYAFDFRNYNCTNYSVATSATNACRDHVNATDELVFVERDPNYYWAGLPTSTVQGCDDAVAPCSGHAWMVKGLTPTGGAAKITVSARAGDVFLPGQVVETTCAKGNQPSLSTVKTRAVATANGDLDVAVTDAVVNDHYQDNVWTDSCYTSVGSGFGVSLFLVNRYRYFVTTINGDPWLMLDRGIDYNNNGSTGQSNPPDMADLIPIAHGVEGLQIAYLLRPDPSGVNAAPDSNTNWVLGDAAGIVEEADPFATAPVQTTLDTDATRFNKHPANIRAVRVRLTVRSLLTDKTQPGSWPGDNPGAQPTNNATNYAAAPLALENRNDFTAVTLGRFRRFNSSVVVATPNLNSKDPFIF